MKSLLLYCLLVLSYFGYSQGTIDVIIGTGNTGTGVAYNNTGTPESPTWTANSAWDIPYVGSSRDPYPAYADLDNDGDYDLIVGIGNGRNYAYENTGDCSAPIWTRRNAWDAPDVGLDARPILMDFDNDGDFDLLIGEDLGVCFYYENTGTITAPSWTARPALNTPDVGSDSSPAAGDLDGDGDFDLLIGEDLGICYAYENTGTITAPSWTVRPAWDTPDIGGSSTDESKPALGDLDNDGDLDLLIGSNSGNTYGYENTGTASSPSWTANATWDPPSVTSESSPTLLYIDDGLGCTPLPIELLSFVVSSENENVKIQWATVSEINNDYFTIERSQDGVSFESFGIIKGAGNSSGIINYIFFDENPYLGSSYYRLKQTDFDGAYAYSDIKVVSLEAVKIINLYPNPTTSLVNILLETHKDMIVEILTINNLGQEVIKRKEVIIAGSNTIELNTSDLNVGNYIFKIITTEKTYVKKFTKD